jgi:outer membrane phospholipase A
MFRGKVILFNSFSYEIPFAVSGYLKTFSSYGEELCKD